MTTKTSSEELFEAVREAAAAGDGEAALELVGRNWRVWHVSSQPDQGGAAAHLALEAGKSFRVAHAHPVRGWSVRISHGRHDAIPGPQ